jgi:hypothetical protein
VVVPPDDHQGTPPRRRRAGLAPLRFHVREGVRTRGGECMTPAPYAAIFRKESTSCSQDTMRFHLPHPLGTPDRAWSSHSRRRRHCRRGDGARHPGATSFHGTLHRANELCDRAGGQHDPRHAVPADSRARDTTPVALTIGSPKFQLRQPCTAVAGLRDEQSKRRICAFTTGSGSARWRFHSRPCRETRSSVRGVVPSPQ